MSPWLIIYLTGWIIVTAIFQASESPPPERFWKTFLVSAMLAVGWPLWAIVLFMP